VVQYVRLHQRNHPAKMGKKEITEFLNFPAGLLTHQQKLQSSTNPQLHRIDDNRTKKFL